MNRFFVYIFLAIIMSSSLLAQDETAEELFEDGDFFYAREEFQEAAYLYRQLLQKEPDNYNGHYKLGMAYLNIEGQEDKAIDHFLKATENTVLKYRKNYYPEKRAPHHAWFYLGNAYRVNNQLAEALEA
ncbi:MAG TPA: tetratricopeptide repeat protein, partial [Bacteroidales bacterium]|nr:tetratricopeptide repeat protein [Bacteroidales bacterium]